MDYFDILERMAWTFAQAFCATLVAILGASGFTAEDINVGIFAGAAIAGLAAVCAFITNVAKQKLKKS